MTSEADEDELVREVNRKALRALFLAAAYSVDMYGGTKEGDASYLELLGNPLGITQTIVDAADQVDAEQGRANADRICAAYRLQLSPKYFGGMEEEWGKALMADVGDEYIIPGDAPVLCIVRVSDEVSAAFPADFVRCVFSETYMRIIGGSVGKTD